MIDCAKTLSSLLLGQSIAEGASRDNPPEELVNKALRKELRIIEQQISTCPADRTELLNEFLSKKAIVEGMAPPLLKDPEAIRQEILSSGTPLEKKAIMDKFKGRADMKIVAEVAKELVGNFPLASS